jgi:hypothetical protein
VERAKPSGIQRETVAAVEQFQGTLSGELWVGGSNIPGQYYCRQNLALWYPGVKPILRIGTPGIVEDVLDGKSNWDLSV